MQDLGLTDQDILHLAESGTIKNSNLTEAEITANIMRDPILIGVTRFICIFDIFSCCFLILFLGDPLDVESETNLPFLARFGSTLIGSKTKSKIHNLPLTIAFQNIHLTKNH